MASTATAISAQMSADEWQTRVDLAACYRLVDLFGWSDLINTRITARVPGQHDHFLINPFGMLYDEITASSLVKIDADGNKVEPSDCEVNSGGFAIPEHDPYGPAGHRLRDPHPHDRRLRRVDAEGRAPAAQPARAAGDRRHRLSRLRGHRPKPRGTRAFPRRFRRQAHHGAAQSRPLHRRDERSPRRLSRPTGWSGPARCSSPSSNRAPSSTRSPTRWSAPATHAQPARRAATTRTRSTGRPCCASSTGSTHPTSNNRARRSRVRGPRRGQPPRSGAHTHHPSIAPAPGPTNAADPRGKLRRPAGRTRGLGDDGNPDHRPRMR